MKHEVAAVVRSAGVALAAMLAAYSPESLSYVGPGAGLGVLAAVATVVIVAVATLVGLVLWPVRWFARRWKAGAGQDKRPGPGNSG